MSKRHTWTESELAVLRHLYQEYSAREIAAVMGLSLKQIRCKAHDLGLRKAAEWIRETARRRALEPGHGGSRSRFARGHATWNKGRKGLHLGGEQTRFRPGTRPHTWQPIGTETIRDGVLWRKVTEGAGDHSRFDWVAVHRALWELHHGPIPPGHVVAFRPGLHTTIAAEITLDRLELIPRAELAARNSWTRYPPELRDAMRGLKQLKRAITTRKEAT